MVLFKNTPFQETIMRTRRHYQLTVDCLPSRIAPSAGGMLPGAAVAVVAAHTHLVGHAPVARGAIHLDTSDAPQPIEVDTPNLPGGNIPGTLPC